MLRLERDRADENFLYKQIISLKIYGLLGTSNLKLKLNKKTVLLFESQ